MQEYLKKEFGKQNWRCLLFSRFASLHAAARRDAGEQECYFFSQVSGDPSLGVTRELQTGMTEGEQKSYSNGLSSKKEFSFKTTF